VVGLVVAGCLGVGAMLLILMFGGGGGDGYLGRAGEPPPMAGPDHDAFGQPAVPTVEPPPIELTMSAWPTLAPPPSLVTTPATLPASAPPARTSSATSAAPRSPSAAAPPPPPRPPSPTPVTYSAVAGYGCPNSATHTFSEVGRYTSGQAGWYSVSSGGWSGDACNGRFDAMEMSGWADTDDPEAYATWSFTVGADSKRCSVSTYVPTSSNSRDVAGKPAQYFVQDTLTGPARAGFTVDQRYTRGTWVGGGTHTVNGGRIVVKLVNRGEDWNLSGRTYEHIAVAQIRLRCTS
jgi:hypothetical protein